MTIESTTRFLYSTMLPAIGLMPLWFGHGRYWMMGVNDWVVTDPADAVRALPGIVVFHGLLFQWERWRPHGVQLPEVALGLWGVYVLQILWQVFYVIVDDGGDASKNYSVATKYWTIPLTVSQRIAMGLAVDTWIVMGATLWVSYWTIDDRRPPPVRLLIRHRMTESLTPAMMYAPVWYTLGHATLGSGCDIWNVTNGTLLLEALLVVLPFHYVLWNRHNGGGRISPTMAYALLLYYGWHLVCQCFVAHDNIVQHYVRGIPVATVALACKGILLTMMLGLLGLSYYEYETETEQTNSVEATATTAAAASTVEPATTTTTPEEELRVPLLSSVDTAAAESAEGGAMPERTEDSAAAEAHTMEQP